MTRLAVFASLLFVSALAQYETTQQTQSISLDPNSGPLKLRIVFQADQQAQQSPCSTGNCQTATATLSPCSTGNCQSSVQQQSPCSTGNCNGIVAGSANIASYDASSTITTTTTTQTPVTVRTISANAAPFKVIRIPSYSSSNSGCFSPPCGPRFVFGPPPCSGNSCGGGFFYPRRRFFPRPIFIGGNNNINSNNVAVPDTIYSNGMAIRAPIRVPSSYQDGNPVFNSGK